jgi:hypothetical protein
MKRNYRVIVISIIVILKALLPQDLNCQTYVRVNVSQSPALMVDAGPDISIDAGQSTMLGETPVATGGTGSLTYQWDPPFYLDNANIQNPLATPPGNIAYMAIVTDERGCIVTDEIGITVIGGTGISDRHAAGDIILYPNPGNGKITLEIRNNSAQRLRVSVLTLSGQMVYNKELISGGGDTPFGLDLSFLPKGSYLMRISGDTFEIHRQIILN